MASTCCLWARAKSCQATSETTSTTASPAVASTVVRLAPWRGLAGPGLLRPQDCVPYFSASCLRVGIAGPRHGRRRGDGLLRPGRPGRDRRRGGGGRGPGDPGRVSTGGPGPGGGGRGGGGRRWRGQRHPVLLQGGQHVGVGRPRLGGPPQRRLALGARAAAEVEGGGQQVAGGVAGVGGEDRRQLLQRLLVLALVGVDARQQHLGAGIVGVGLHALLADHHRFHEAAGGQVGLGEGAVGVGRGIGGERVLEAGELRGRELSLGAGHGATED